MFGEALRLYEAATSSQYRPVISNSGSADADVNAAGTRLRQLARHLEENHDLVVSIFDDLVNNIIGTGARVAPMVRMTNGALARGINRQISELWDQWAQSPETTGELGLETAERLICRSYLRDGEEFTQLVTTPRFNYQTPVPLALELLEADFVPFEMTDQRKNLFNGIELNQWGAPTIYHVYKNHPGDPLTQFQTNQETKAVSAQRMLHPKFSRRLRQRRGVPIIHAVINRLRDVNDYEQSERIAAKVAADLTWFIERTSEYNGMIDVNEAKNRTLQMAAGAGFSLLPGEKVGTIKSERPNSGLIDFRNAMLKAVAGGTGSRYSSIARDYSGTYSAQRQELVEGAVGYRTHFVYLVRRIYRPIYASFIDQILFGGLLRLERGIDMATIRRVDFRAPALPWIDPAKEAKAYETLIDKKLESHAEIIRQRGRDPEKVREELEEEQADGVFSDTIAASTPAEEPTEPQVDDDENDADEAVA
jgi:lambda family phage portal protein